MTGNIVLCAKHFVVTVQSVTFWNNRRSRIINDVSERNGFRSDSKHVKVLMLISRVLRSFLKNVILNELKNELDGPSSSKERYTFKFHKVLQYSFYDREMHQSFVRCWNQLKFLYIRYISRLWALLKHSTAVKSVNFLRWYFCYCLKKVLQLIFVPRFLKYRVVMDESFRRK